MGEMQDWQMDLVGNNAGGSGINYVGSFGTLTEVAWTNPQEDYHMDFNDTMVSL